MTYIRLSHPFDSSASGARVSVSSHANLLRPCIQGFQGYDLSILRIRYLVPRMFLCAVFSCLDILRIDGCLSSILEQCS